MQMQYQKKYSHYLRREMEYKQYGEGGTPCLVLPTGSGRFYEWEDAGMAKALAGLIEAGRVTLFCADGIYGESWLGRGETRRRAEMQERWHAYLCEELYSELQSRCPDAPALALGCDLGAAEAVLLALRAPGQFAGCVALSGRYDAAGFFGTEKDDLVFRNNPMQFLPALPAGSEQLAALANQAIWLCAGQGPDEAEPLAGTRALAEVLQSKGLTPRLDIWGYDVTHSWPWWNKQMPYLLQKALAEQETAQTSAKAAAANAAQSAAEP